MQSRPRILGPLASKMLCNYYLGPDHRMKLRIWTWFRRLQRYRRLSVPYATIGWMTLDERDYLQHRILVTGSYEPEVWECLFAFAQEREVVWDVGANIGSFAVRSGLERRVREVHAFEPDPAHASVLRANLDLNPGRYVLHQIALGDVRQPVNLYRATFPHTGGSNLGMDLGNGGCSVECHTCDDLIFHQGVAPPSLMKIDVEGWELNLFKGARRLFEQGPPKAMVFEADSDHEGRMMDTRIRELLSQYGYSVSWVQRPEGAVYHRENYLAVRSDVFGSSEDVLKSAAQ